MSDREAWKSPEDYDADLCEMSVISAKEDVQRNEDTFALAPVFGRGLKKRENYSNNNDEDYYRHLAPIKGSRSSPMLEQPGFPRDNARVVKAGRGQKVKDKLQTLQTRSGDKDRQIGIQNELRKVFSTGYFSNEYIEEKYGARSSSASPSVSASEEEGAVAMVNGIPEKRASPLVNSLLPSNSPPPLLNNGFPDTRASPLLRNGLPDEKSSGDSVPANFARAIKKPPAGPPVVGDILNIVDFPPLT